MNKILYVGANLHLDVLKHFPDHKFVMIDSLPLNEYGYDYYARYFYHDGFVDKLHYKFTQLDFVLKNTSILTNNFDEINKKYLEATLLEYTNPISKQIVHYYISTCIPVHLHRKNIHSFQGISSISGISGISGIPDLIYDIKQCNGLIICGHIPHSDIAEYLADGIVLIGYSDTVYPNLSNANTTTNENIDNEDLLLQRLVDKEWFSEYIAVKRENGEKNIFKKYEDFYQFIRKY